MIVGLLTTAQLAEALGTTEQAIRDRVHRTRGTADPFPHRKLGKSRQSPLRFDLDDVLAYMEAAAA